MFTVEIRVILHTQQCFRLHLMDIILSTETFHSFQPIAMEYYQRMKKMLRTKLNGGNTVKPINAWAGPALRYTADIIDRKQAELGVR